MAERWPSSGALCCLALGSLHLWQGASHGHLAREHAGAR
ncbi:hypothetical protein PG5_19580 [Pseudomonas sp. G5(2012)]|nr:hypothetical protein PG5_19580 [Pseudomonas sp. G5(2012)]